MSGATSRTKGASGEREVCTLIHDLTGWPVRRRVRNDHGDSDLTGIPGWCAEVKRHKTALPGEVAAWWAQAVQQAERAEKVPVLFYRADRREWRAVWPLSCVLAVQTAVMWADIKWTADTSLDGWAAVARELQMAGEGGA